MTWPYLLHGNNIIIIRTNKWYEYLTNILNKHLLFCPQSHNNLFLMRELRAYARQSSENARKCECIETQGNVASRAHHDNSYNTITGCVRRFHIIRASPTATRFLAFDCRLFQEWNIFLVSQDAAKISMNFSSKHSHHPK